jgi:hypothetical protein
MIVKTPASVLEMSVIDTSKSDLLKWWDGELDKLRFTLTRNLCSANLLNSNQCDSLLAVFGDEIVMAQRGFMARAAALCSSGHPMPIRESMCVINYFKPVELLTSCSAGLAAVETASSWVVATVTTGHLWWQKSENITFVVSLATTLHAPAGLVLAGIFFLGGWVTFRLFRAVTAGFQQRYMRRRVMMKFDQVIRPRLESWASQTLNA